MGRIVIVEDEADIIALYRIVLEKAGHQILQVGSAPDRLRGNLAERFDGADVAILDERLGGVSGTAFLPGIRAANPRLRILVASADPEALDRAIGLGANEVRRKPFPLRQLTDDVARLLALAPEVPAEDA